MRSPPSHDLKIHQSRRKPVGNGKNIIGKILDEHVRNCISPVNQIKNFQAGPDIIEISERGVTPPVRFFRIQEKRAETNIHPDIGRDGQCIAILDAAWNIIRKVTAVNGIQINLEIFVRG